MNAEDILKYGHLLVLDTAKMIPEAEWNRPNVCGWWSTRQIFAHLAVYEILLVDVLGQVSGSNPPIPTLDLMIKTGPDVFNDQTIPARDGMTLPEVLVEYTDAYQTVSGLLPQISIETRRQTGTLPWYGMEYDVEDFLVYSYYAHKREHCTQIAVFKDLLVREGKLPT